MASSDINGRSSTTSAGALDRVALVTTAEGVRAAMSARLQRPQPGALNRARRREFMVLTAGVLLGLIGWAIAGRAVALPVAIIVALSVQAAFVDSRTLRIPNRLVLGSLTVLALGIPFVAIADHRALGAVTAGVAVGWLLSGAPVMFGLWLVRPAGIGGGDWKLLCVLGAAVGFLAPVAGALILLVAIVVQGGQSLLRRRRHGLPLGPGLATGYIAAVAAGVVFHDLLGGVYT